MLLCRAAAMKRTKRDHGVGHTPILAEQLEEVVLQERRKPNGTAEQISAYRFFHGIVTAVHGSIGPKSKQVVLLISSELLWAPRGKQALLPPTWVVDQDRFPTSARHKQRLKLVSDVSHEQHSRL